MNTKSINDTTEQQEISYSTSRWLDELPTANSNKINSNPPVLQKNKKKTLIYLIGQHSHTASLSINLALCNILKSGKLGSESRFNFANESHRDFLNHADCEIINWIIRHKKVYSFYEASDYDEDKFFVDDDIFKSELLDLLVATQRCFWQTKDNTHLTYGKEQHLGLKWQVNDEGGQRLVFDSTVNYKKLITADGAYVLSEDLATVHPVKTEKDTNKESDKLYRKLLTAPEILPNESKVVNNKLKSIINTAKFSCIENVKVIDKQHINNCLNIVPELEIGSIVHQKLGRYYFDELVIPYIKVAFYYDGIKVYCQPGRIDENKEAIQYKNGKLVAYQRDLKREKGYFTFLRSKLNVKLKYMNDHTYFMPSIDLEDQVDRDRIVNQFNKIRPELKAKGWRVLAKSIEFMEMIDENSTDVNLEWYSDVEQSDNNYFDYKFGLKIDGQEINLLPVLVDIIKQQDVSKLEIPAQEKVAVPINDGCMLSVQYSRIKPIVDTIYELYNLGYKFDSAESLRLEKRRLALLKEMQQANVALKMRWHGSEALMELSNKLSNFSSIASIAPPEGLHAKLREYQQEGLNWLCFLKEFGFSGILADDMGLGKTIQVLSLVLKVKETGALTKPVLVVVPTSLVYNWKSEAEKFCPGLSILDFHGSQRKAQLDKSNKQFLDYDIVITTYNLLLYDKDIITNNEFSYLILDEAQNIKNFKAKTTFVAQQIKADNRLCMTGTPVENNLDELWSLFNFIMPGFLGNNTEFKKFFRTPIEKQNSLDKKQYLAKRIKPFILRRTKQEVVQELPPKTEIIHKVEISGKQQELYETIRIAMQEKLQKVIADKGLNRSHIMILDAILKLRQVCCDPRILNVESKLKEGCAAAKLIELEAMLESFIKEGRKVIIFSQFVSMISLFEEMLDKNGYKYSKITGNTQNRKKQVADFQDGDNKVFLISLKAGGTGLNLTAADTIIHFDPWWNPAVEDQASDRAHRIGQDKPVFVYKFIVSGSIEETILEMQNKKREIVSGLYDQGAGKINQLTQEDLKDLFAPLSC